MVKNNKKDFLEKNPLFICWTAFNEENTLEDSYVSAKKSILFSKNKFLGKYKKELHFRGIICHNGCTDKTPEIADKISSDSEEYFRVDVLKSERGMVKAQQKCIDYIKKANKLESPVLFLDADCLIDEKALFMMIEELKKHKKLKIVGGQPTPLRYKGLNPYKRLLDNILNFRAYHPSSEIAVNPNKSYHAYARIDPQYLGANFEEKSKIYFHGRFFMMRNVKCWDVKKDFGAEDIYLGRSINFKYGPGSIRMLYHANVFFSPILSLFDYYKIYLREFKFLDQLRKSHPEFEEIRNYSKTKMDLKYRKRLSLIDKIYFDLHNFLRFIVYNLSKKGIFFTCGKNIWSYESKSKLIK